MNANIEKKILKADQKDFEILSDPGIPLAKELLRKDNLHRAHISKVPSLGIEIVGFGFLPFSSSLFFTG